MTNYENKYWFQLLKEAVKDDGIFPPMATINVVAPSADEFFEALYLLDSEYFDNASERLEVDGYSVRHLYCFQNFYCKDEECEYSKHSTIYDVQAMLNRTSNAYATHLHNRYELQQSIDRHLLTA